MCEISTQFLFYFTKYFMAFKCPTGLCFGDHYDEFEGINCFRFIRINGPKATARFNHALIARGM